MLPSQSSGMHLCETRNLRKKIVLEDNLAWASLKLDVPVRTNQKWVSVLAVNQLFLPFLLPNILYFSKSLSYDLADI